MSDVSKTNEALIAEAQQHYSEMNGLNSRAAEVMMELVAALEAKTGVRVDMSSAVGVEAQLAATRVPVQGEPNDELIAEALDNVLIDAREAGDGLSAVRNRILAAGFSRATVPDAATERYKDAAEGNRIRLVHAQDDVVRAEAERDAALDLMNRHECDEAAEAAYQRIDKLRARVAELERRDAQASRAIRAIASSRGRER